MRIRDALARRFFRFLGFPDYFEGMMAMEEFIGSIEVVIDEDGNHWMPGNSFIFNSPVIRTMAVEGAIKSAKFHSSVYPTALVHVHQWGDDPRYPILIGVYRNQKRLEAHEEMEYAESVEFDESIGWTKAQSREDDEYDDDDDDHEPIGQEAFENSYIGGGGAPDYDNI